jgi:tetrapyrrole methylase family protein/MazG family protein
VVEIVRLEPGPIPQELADRLQGLPVFLAEASPETERRLRLSGISVTVATEVPDGALLILPRRPLDELAHVVDRLLGPGGCPWDQAQTHETLKKHLVEETYEVLEAIDSGEAAKLREELGDLLLQPFMHAQIRKLRTGEFDIDAVASEIVEKLVRRHPHVFGDIEVADADEVLKNWDRIKQQEKGAPDEAPRSILAGVPKAMPALLRAFEVSKRAARSGFEWPDIESVFDKLREEETELRAEIPGGDAERVESEVGDLLFTAVNIARWAKVEPEEALRRMLDRFTGRFMEMERLATKPLRELTADEWDDLWNRAKATEKG